MSPNQGRINKRGRGRPKGFRKIKKCTIDNNSDNKEVVIIKSSPESCRGKNVIFLSESFEESKKCLESSVNSIDSAIDSVIAESRRQEQNRLLAITKDVRVMLTRAEYVPGLMTAKQKSDLVKRSQERKKNITLNRRKEIKVEKAKPKETLIIETISISSSSIASDWSRYQTTPKKSKKKSQKSKQLSKIKEIKEESRETEIITPDKKKTARPLNFGEESIKLEKIEEVTTSNNDPSSASGSTLGTAKRKRSNSESKVHPFEIDLNESNKNQRLRKSAKRSRKDNGEKKDKLCKQLENQMFINANFGLSKEPIVKRADDSKASKSDATQSAKLTDAVDNSPGTKRIESAKDLIGIGSGKKSIASDLCSLINGNAEMVDMGDLPQFLDCNVDMKMINDLETNGTEVLTLFSSSDHALDKDSCTLDSISQAIDKDVAEGNRLSPIPSHLLPFSSTSDHEENRVEDIKHRLNCSSKSNESFRSLPSIGKLQNGLSNGTEIFENNTVRKRPAIMEDEILPKGCTINLQTIRDNRRRKRLSQTVHTPVLSIDNMLGSSIDKNRNVDVCEINTARDQKISVAETELEALLLNDNSANNNNNSACAKNDFISEDVLNNNRGTMVANKREINSQKQQNTITMYTAPPDTEVGTLKDHLDDMERFLQGGDSNVLENGKADVETRSETVNLNECDIDQVLAEYTKANDINLERAECLTNAENGKTESIRTLTVQNLDAFNDCIVEGKITSAIRRETIETDVCSLRTDVTGGTTESGKIRKRKWVANGETMTYTQSPGSKITLNRRKWSKESRDGSEKSIDRIVEIEEPIEKLPLIGEQKSRTESRVIDEAVSVINEISRKLISPIMGGQECNNGIRITESGGGDSSLYNRATSTPTKHGVPPVIDEDDSSSSSSSDSSSSSSSSSSSEDSSDESEDEDSMNYIPINGEIEVATTKKDDVSRQSDIEKRCSISAVPLSAENNIIPSFGAKAQTLETVTETAGSLIDHGNCPEDLEDDKSDCISLDTESLCMSRCASPDSEPPKPQVPDVSPKQKPKPGNVKSRLGPRVDVETVPNSSTATTTNNIIRIRTTTNNVPNVQSEENDPNNITVLVNNNYANINVCQEQAPSNILQVHPEVLPSIEPIPTLTSENDVEMLLRGHCFGWLKTGTCGFSECRFHHRPPNPIMSHIGNVANHRWILYCAIRYQYRHFIAEIQRDLMILMPSHQVIEFCFFLCTNGFLNDIHFTNVIAVLVERGLTIVEIVDLFAVAMQHQPIECVHLIMGAFCKILQPGTRWETLKRMMMQMPSANLPLMVVVEVVNECVTFYPEKSHLDDIWENLVSKLPEETVGARGDLFKSFYDLRTATMIIEGNDMTVETRERTLTCNIVSPESPRESEKDQNFPHAAHFNNRESAASPTPFIQSQASTSAANESQAASTSGASNSYCLKPIDQLPSAKSAYGESIWKFHLDLQGVREGLKHRDYDLVINILTVNQRTPDRLPHMAGFYSILCSEIMSSRHHLDEIIRRAVHSGASDELHRYIYDLGVYVLTTLADTGAWILAYGLLKTFKVYGQYNTCAYTLLSAEICIANHRPLKALAILKQSGLVFSNQRQWNQMWCPEDEPLRISVMELLLISLCDGHAEYALSLMEFILKEQCSNFKPINISRHVDRIARSLLSENRTHAIVDLGRLIIENNLFVDSTIFRAMINRVFHSDQFLAKQLHRYSTWLGAYNMPKISGITHMIVNIDWTEEEMYLMFSSLIYELYLNIGHAIDRLRPRQLAVYLILEAMPTERQLSRDDSGLLLSNAEINKRRALVKKVCDRFDPKIKVIQKAQGKFCKIRSESLVNYLKAGHFK